MVLTFVFTTSIYAFDFTIGNSPVANRANVDTYQNFSIVDTNNPAGFDGVITQIQYYARNTNPFKFLIVDGTGKVEWKSDLITPAGTGVQTFTPITVPTVHTGWNVGMYFQSTGTIPWDLTGAADPAYYEANNAGEPAIGEVLTVAGTTTRYYSFLASGWKNITTPVITGFLSPTLSCGALTNIHSTTINWTDSTGGVGGVVGYEYTVDYPLGGGVGHWTTFVTNSQYTGSLNEGLHSVKVRAKDSAGNFSAWSNVCSLTTDWTVPVVAITNPIDPTTVGGTINIRGTVTDAHPHHYWLAIYKGSTVVFSTTVNRSNSFTDELLKVWTPLEDGIYVIKLAARDSANNRSGDVQVTINVDNDIDNDGVNDTADKCVGTFRDQPDEGLGINRWKRDSLGQWYTRLPKTTNDELTPPPYNTYGCSCEQILDKMSEVTGGDFGGHHKFGCSKSILEDWERGTYHVGLVPFDNVEVPGTSNAIISSSKDTENGTNYELTATGTYTFVNWLNAGIADASCSLRIPGSYNNTRLIAWIPGSSLPSPYTNFLELQVNGAPASWGECSLANTYTKTFSGTGVPFSFQVLDNAYGDNSGSLFVNILEDKWVNLW